MTDESLAKAYLSAVGHELPDHLTPWDEEPPKRVCGWCGGEPCEGIEARQPHHGLCCLDGQPKPCWQHPSDGGIVRLLPDDFGGTDD